MFCGVLKDRIQNWLRDYDRLQYLAVILIYIQIGCALIGSLGALYNGVLLINLGIALFALVAIESSSQSLGRTYAVLLFCTILLDISWFILFTSEIWNISPDKYGTFFIFSVKLTLAMQIVGFSVSPVAPAVARQCSDCDVVLGGSIYDPAYYSSLFEDGRNNRFLRADQHSITVENGSTSSTEGSQFKVSIDRSLQNIEENVDDKLQIV
ncbi:hypothetical protein M5689_016494 [Euphorbia peplus]|nr:hypothetical protein M5689_016494 [Euphorbia peplus]